MPERAFNLFSFNAPAWSLFWEYMANIVYGFLFWRIRRFPLLILTILSAALLCFIGYREGSLMGGWSGGTFWDGGARVVFSFSAGLLVYRLNWRIKNSFGFVGLSILLVLAFFMPFGKWNWLTESAVVLFYFPFLVALGAGATPGPASRKLCILSGQLSYPLYMTHYWAIWLFANYYQLHHPTGLRLFLIVTAGVSCLLGIAWLTMISFDIPVRAWLSKKRRAPLF